MVASRLLFGVFLALQLVSPRFVSAQTAEPTIWPAVAGDIILHQSTSRQATAVSAATGSRYTHMGLVFEHDGQWQVLEAVEPVRWTPLAAWIDRGRNDQIVVVRLVDTASLPPGWRSSLQTAATSYLGRPYDLLFGWSDDAIYCSELVYKAYETATGLQIAAQVTFADLQMDEPAVQALLRQRDASDFDLTAPVVTPDAFLTSPLLEVVFSTDPTIVPSTGLAE